MKRFFSVYISIALLCMIGCSGVAPRFRDIPKSVPQQINQIGSIESYIHLSADRIKKYRQDLTPENQDLIISANSPEILLPDTNQFPKNANGKFKRGLLLVHGLSNSPYEMRGLARYFQSRGFVVFSMLLSGHGTIPGDLLDADLEDWLVECEFGITELKKKADMVGIAGFSLGGAIACYLGMEQPELSPVFAFSPSLTVDPYAIFTTLGLAPTWLSKAEDSDYARYESFSSHAAAQAYYTSRKIHKALKEKKQLVQPCFMAVSADDTTVDSREVLTMFKNNVTLPESRLLIYITTPDLTPKDKRVKLADSRDPDRNIISFSHMSMVVPPDDPHYGENGDYRHCYFLAEKIQKDCFEAESIPLGEYTKENKKNHPLMARLMFNPFFDDMCGQMDVFLTRTKTMP